MNEIGNKFLLAADKFVPGMHLRQPGFTYSACGPFIKNRKKERIKKLKETGDCWDIYQNELVKACFNMNWLIDISKAYLEEQLHIKYCVVKHLILLKIWNTMDIKGVLLQWFTIF